VIETATFATSTRHVTPIERKPLYHFRPGAQALTLAAPGCTFACRYCQNHRLSQYGRNDESSWSASPITAEEVVAEATAAGVHAIAFSYSEPVLSAELTLAIAPLARAAGLSVCWKSNGFIHEAAIAPIAAALDAACIDIKVLDEDRHRQLTAAPVGPVLETIRALIERGVWVEVATPVIPGINEDHEQLSQIAAAIADIGRSIPWHLIRFVPEYRLRDHAPATPAQLRAAVEIGRSHGLRHVYVDRVFGAHGRATSCSECGHVVVERGVGSFVSQDFVDDRCPRCHHRIPGVWSPCPSPSSPSEPSPRSSSLPIFPT
jgi:pyruvate formate lyase activating enzyme